MEAIRHQNQSRGGVPNQTPTTWDAVARQNRVAEGIRCEKRMYGDSVLKAFETSLGWGGGMPLKNGSPFMLPRSEILAPRSSVLQTTWSPENAEKMITPRMDRHPRKKHSDRRRCASTYGNTREPPPEVFMQRVRAEMGVGPWICISPSLERHSSVLCKQRCCVSPASEQRMIRFYGYFSG